MRIGDKNYLLAEKRGCDFFSGDTSVKGSDVGNYRVLIRFIAKDGTEVCGDVMRFRGGMELASQMCRYDGAANCTGFPYHWMNSMNMDSHGSRYPYTIAGILEYVNDRSRERYDAIKWVRSFSFDQKPGENYTPSWKIAEWAKKEHLEYWQPAMSCLRVRMFGGVWKYFMSKVRTFQGTTGPFERVTIFLEEGE